MLEDRVSQEVTEPVQAAAKASPPVDFVVHRSPWRFQLRHLILFVFYSAIVCWLATLFAAAVVFASLALLGAAILMIAVLVARRRSQQQDVLIRMMTVAANHNMSLASALRACSEESTGSYKNILTYASQDLDQGTSLPEVFERYPKLLSQDLALIARMGWWSGLLGGALREASSSRLGFRSIWASIVWRTEYLLGVIFTTQTIVSFLLYFIIPKFEAIFYDFGIQLPPITIELIHVSHMMGGHSILMGLAGLLELFVLLYFPYSLFGMPDKGITPIDRLFVRRHSAIILRSLAWVVESDKPIQSGITALAEWYPTGWVQSRLCRVMLDVHHGVDWIESLRYHGLIRASDKTLLESGRRVGNLSWVMRTVADIGETRFTHRIQFIVQFMFCVALIMIGLLVGTIGVAYFMPLAQLIERLAG